LEIREDGMKNRPHDRMPTVTNEADYDAFSGAVSPHSSDRTIGSAWSSLGVLIALVLLACVTAAVLSPPPPETPIGVGIGTD
jgi:hypothetical protein